MKEKDKRAIQPLILRRPFLLESISQLDLNCKVYLTTEGSEFRKEHDGRQSKSKFAKHKCSKQGKLNNMSSKNIDDINDKITRIIQEISLTCKANEHSVKKRKQVSPKRKQKSPKRKQVSSKWRQASSKWRQASPKELPSQVSKTKKKQEQRRVSFQVLEGSKRSSFQNERVSSFDHSGQSSLTSSQVDQSLKRINDKITTYQSKIREQKGAMNFSKKNKENHHAAHLQIVPNDYCKDCAVGQKVHNGSQSQLSQIEAGYRRSIRRITTDKSEASLRIVSQNSSVVNKYSHFAKCLKKQIDLDHNLRQAKHLYAGLGDLFSPQQQAGQKWKQLKDHLKSSGMDLHLEEVIQIFAPREDEIDPFLSVSHSHEQLAHSLILAFEESEQYWWSVMHQKWSPSDLSEAGLNRQNLDRQRKGWVSLGDLTSFADGLLDGDYRNRDLMLLYRRLEKGGDLKFNQIYTELVKV